MTVADDAGREVISLRFETHLYGAATEPPRGRARLT